MKITYEINDYFAQEIDRVMSEHICTGSNDEQRVETITEYIQWCLDNWFENSGQFNGPDVADSIRYWLYEEKDIDLDDTKL